MEQWKLGTVFFIIRDKDGRTTSGEQRCWNTDNYVRIMTERAAKDGGHFESRVVAN